MNNLLPLGLTLLLASGSASASPGLQVLAVGDGDSITVTSPNGKVRVRLACIDAPESSQHPAGPAARAALQQLLPVGSTVMLQEKAVDRYGRTMAEVFTHGRNINQALVADGMAFVYADTIADCDRNAYARLEEQARGQRLGVWGPRLGYDLMFPWDYRACKQAGRCR